MTASSKQNASATHSTQRATTQRTWRPDVQGIRALAVTLVVCYHAGLGINGGFVGVDVFFVVSGFVICNLLLRDLDGRGTFSFAAFYTRRARRLLPALALVSLVTLVGAVIGISPLGDTQPAVGRAASAASVFIANGYFSVSSGGYFQPVAAANPFLHTWSLSVEEQFYLVFPLTLFAAWKLFRARARRLVALAIFFVAVSLLCGLALTYGMVPNLPGLSLLVSRPDLALRLAFYSPMSRAWEFLAGVIVALVARNRHLSRTGAAVLAPLGLGIVLISACVISASDPFPGALAGLPVVGTAAIIAAGTAQRSTPITMILETRWIVRVGDWSYSWYLWHWPAIVFAQLWFPNDKWIWAAAAFGALGPAILSYHYVEQPIRHRRIWPTHRQTAYLVAACVVIPLTAGLAVTLAANRNWGSSEVASIESVVRPIHADAMNSCDTTYPIGSSQRPPCIWAVPDSRGTILLVGDSNAGHLSEPMIDVARRLQMSLQIVTFDGCPFLLRKSYTSPECKSVVQSDLKTIETRRPAYAAVVISNADVSYLNNISVGGGSQRERAIENWIVGLKRTDKEISARSPVVNVGAIPHYLNIPNCLMPSIIFRHGLAGCGHLSASDAHRLYGSIVDAERVGLASVSAGFANLQLLLCNPRAGCDVYRKDTLMYRDDAHLSVIGSLEYVPMFYAILKRVVNHRRR